MYGLFILFNLSLFTAKTTIKVNYQYYACLNIYNSNNSKVQTNRRAKNVIAWATTSTHINEFI